jgi:GNAT superfamily N-acetyltransferase
MGSNGKGGTDFELIEVPLSDRKLVERFIKVPWHVNRDHHPSGHWVPPLLMDRRDYLTPKKNPFFDHVQAAFWMVRRNGVDVGRIAAVKDADYIAFHEDNTGYYGMFECIDDHDVATALVDAASTWLREHGLDRAIGPFELSTNYISGVLVEGFDRDPGINMPYNPPYYDELLTSCGLSKAKDLWQWALDVTKPVPERLVKIADRVAKRAGITIRNFDLAKWDDEVGICLDIYNDAWEKNWGFVPVGEKEFRHMAKDLKMVIDGKLGWVAEVEGKPVAFALSIFNLNPVLKNIDGKLFPTGIFRLIWDTKISNKVTGGRLILMGVRAEYRNTGIISLLMVKTHQGGNELGLTEGEIGWTLEDNDKVNKAIERMGGTRCATYRVFEKKLSEKKLSEKTLS